MTLSGEELTDTDDEQSRQQLARMMVEEKGYAKEDLEPRRYIETLFLPGLCALPLN